MIRSVISTIAVAAVAYAAAGCAAQNPVTLHGYKIIEVNDPKLPVADAYYAVRAKMMRWETQPDGSRQTVGMVSESGESWQEDRSTRSVRVFEDAAGIRHTFEEIRIPNRPALLVLDATENDQRTPAAAAAVMEFNNAFRSELSNRRN